jgi:murein DD-endopeptidase MepM/ murein hydrolase activator NlpD
MKTTKRSLTSFVRRCVLPGLLALTLAVPGPARAQGGGLQYVVQEGDTLYTIALSFGISLATLQAANPTIDPAALGVGQSVVIPGYENIAGTLSTLTVGAGESLDSLSLRTGLARTTLIELNRVVNPHQLYLNQTLVVVDQPDAGPPIAAGQTYAAPPGAGLFALAAARNTSPWALARVNRLAHPGRLAPGELVVVPGGERPPLALPYPLGEIQIGPVPPTQGETLVVKVTASQPLTLTGQFGDDVLHFNTADPAANAQVALQGIYRLADPDLYPLSVVATDAAGQTFTFAQPVPVRPRNQVFDEPLTVNPATLDPAATEPENLQVRAVVEPVTPVRLWDGLFVLPSVGAWRSMFGSLRSYNGGPYDSFHGGMDFSGGEDRPITAPAPGVVVFVGPLTVRGNATIIDHGWGVYTGYWHQSSIVVEVGQRVETGQILGYNGATGRVTGPHLHWELYVGGRQVNPLTWTEVVFP